VRLPVKQKNRNPQISPRPQRFAHTMRASHSYAELLHDEQTPRQNRVETEQTPFPPIILSCRPKWRHLSLLASEARKIGQASLLWGPAAVASAKAGRLAVAFHLQRVARSAFALGEWSAFWLFCRRRSDLQFTSLSGQKASSGYSSRHP
jgi:hypothetical protein